MVTIDTILNEFGAKIVAKLRDDIVNTPTTKYGPVNASGDMAKSLRYEVANGVLRIYGNDYFFYLVHGRKPGKYPPKENILKWIRDKGIKPIDISENSLAFLIQRKIAKFGTTIYEQNGSSLLRDAITTEMVEDFTKALEAQMASAIVDSSIDKAFIIEIPFGFEL